MFCHVTNCTFVFIKFFLLSPFADESFFLLFHLGPFTAFACFGTSDRGPRFCFRGSTCFTAVSSASELWTFTVSCKKVNEFGEVWLIQVGIALTTYACREEPSVTCWWWESPGVSGPFTAVSSASEPWTFTASCK